MMKVTLYIWIALAGADVVGCLWTVWLMRRKRESKIIRYLAFVIAAGAWRSASTLVGVWIYFGVMGSNWPFALFGLGGLVVLVLARWAFLLWLRGKINGEQGE